MTRNGAAILNAEEYNKLQLIMMQEEIDMELNKNTESDEELYNKLQLMMQEIEMERPY